MAVTLKVTQMDVMISKAFRRQCLLPTNYSQYSEKAFNPCIAYMYDIILHPRSCDQTDCRSPRPVLPDSPRTVTVIWNLQKLHDAAGEEFRSSNWACKYCVKPLTFPAPNPSLTSHYSTDTSSS